MTMRQKFLFDYAKSQVSLPSSQRANVSTVSIKEIRFAIFLKYLEISHAIIVDYLILLSSAIRLCRCCGCRPYMDVYQIHLALAASAGECNWLPGWGCAPPL